MMNINNKARQLLVIGNGFDLYNNVNSSFSKFIMCKYKAMNRFIKEFRSNSKIVNDHLRLKLLKKSYYLIHNNENNKVTSLRNCIKSYDFNYWVFCLLLQKYDNTNWDDIEQYLHNSLMGLNKSKSLNIKSICIMMFSLLNGYNEKCTTLTALVIYLILINCNDFKYSDYGNIRKYLNNSHNISLDGVKNQLFRYLRVEIIDFDLSFNDYMFEFLHSKYRSQKTNHLRERKTFYREKSYNLICDVLKDFTNGKYDPHISHFNVLDFNYTNPLFKFHSILHKDPLYICRHIHGSLLSKYINYVDFGTGKSKLSNSNDRKPKVRRALNIFYKEKNNKIKKPFNRVAFHLWCYKNDRNIPIIGIDGSHISVQTPKFEFTKTYNILRRTSYGRRGLLSKHIRYIKFFGHSLGRADYSYFEDIFDKYDIFNSPVMLVFYYCPYRKNETDAEASRNELHNVSKLLEHYCKAKNYRTNALLSRLLLEGRLVIRNITYTKY